MLSYYVVADWREGCERCIQILRYGGMGHTMSIHSRNDAGHPRVRPEEAGVPHRRQHADDARIDWPDDGLDPAMTLGCGGYGGNITSDNISPRHLLNIKRLAYELRPAVRDAATVAAARRRAPAPTTGAAAESCRRRRARAGVDAPADATAGRRLLWRAGAPAGRGAPPRTPAPVRPSNSCARKT